MVHEAGVSRFDRDVARRTRLAMTAKSEAWKSLSCIMRLADQIRKECATWEEAGKRRAMEGVIRRSGRNFMRV